MASSMSPRQPKRPSLAPRRSSSSQHLSSSPLSSSAQKKPHRQQHVVGRIGLGARVPSAGKINRLGSKLALTPAYADDTPGFRPTHVKRNSSNLNLTKGAATQINLRKNQSDTSLRRNRSGNQLQKLPKVASSKRIHKKTKSESKAARELQDELRDHDGHADRAVHFNLGDEEDAWTEESASPNTTRDNSQKNSIIIEPPTPDHRSIMQKEGVPALSTSIPLASPKFTPGTSQTPGSDIKSSQESPERRRRENSRTFSADKLTTRLLRRNVSFSAAAPTKLSSISASGSHDRQSPPQFRSRAASTTDSPDPGNAARNSHFSSSNGGTPRESSFLPQNSMGTDQYGHRLDMHRRQPSGSNISGPVSRSDSPRSGILTPSSMPLSRTQQKLWLERASANLEHQQVLPPGLLRSSRLGGGAIPFHNVSSDELFQKQLKQLFEQTDNVYRRIRTFQNPLADSVSRLQDAAITPRTKLMNRPNAKQSAAAGSGDGKFGLSQSVHTNRTSNNNRDANTGNRRTRVTFQGITATKDDSDIGRRQQGHVEDDEDSADEDAAPRNEVREICRRLWERQVVADGE